MANGMSFSIGAATFSLTDMHPALVAAINEMKRTPYAVKLAVENEVNAFLAAHADDEGTKHVKMTGGKASATWKATAKATTVTVKGTAGLSVKMPATAAATFAALNDRLLAVSEMFCAIDAVRLPSALREWIRENVPAVKDAEAAA